VKAVGETISGRQKTSSSLAMLRMSSVISLSGSGMSRQSFFEPENLLSLIETL
jgi:hypothetical protein